MDGAPIYRGRYGKADGSSAGSYGTGASVSPPPKSGRWLASSGPAATPVAKSGSRSPTGSAEPPANLEVIAPFASTTTPVIRPPGMKGAGTKGGPSPGAAGDPTIPAAPGEGGAPLSRYGDAPSTAAGVGEPTATGDGLGISVRTKAARKRPTA